MERAVAVVTRHDAPAGAAYLAVSVVRRLLSALFLRLAIHEHPHVHVTVIVARVQLDVAHSLLPALLRERQLAVKQRTYFVAYQVAGAFAVAAATAGWRRWNGARRGGQDGQLFSVKEAREVRFVQALVRSAGDGLVEPGE